ncbi:hypothetical protein CerSpe_288290 [Prunus speciosa]
MSVSIDMKIVGNVIWVGKSSIEIQLEVTQPSQDVDSKTEETVPVNHLLRETKQEKALFEETEARNGLRKSKRGKELGTNHQK